MIPELSFRAANASDEALLFEIFASARHGHPEMEGCTAEEATTMIESDFEARQRSYAADFPGVEFMLVCSDEEPIGRLYLQRARRVIFIVDLVLLPPWRGMGLGSHLLRRLLGEARVTRRVVRLHVEKINQGALRLYSRLGFLIIDDVRTHYLMEAHPP
ncbi:MAG: GNAT family N-acetyltransferase [Verrucomicrobiales bacterium]